MKYGFTAEKLEYVGNTIVKGRHIVITMLCSCTDYKLGQFYAFFVCQFTLIPIVLF